MKEERVYLFSVPRRVGPKAMPISDESLALHMSGYVCVYAYVQCVCAVCVCAVCVVRMRVSCADTDLTLSLECLSVVESLSPRLLLKWSFPFQHSP